MSNGSGAKMNDCARSLKRRGVLDGNGAAAKRPPSVLPLVRAFHARVGQCQRCGRPIQGPASPWKPRMHSPPHRQIGTATASVLHE